MDLDQIARRLWQPIPRPRPKRARAQASWQQLKPGQQLKCKLAMVVGGQRVPTGAVWEVIETDSQGAWLVWCNLLAEGLPTGDRSATVPVRMRWTDRDWKRVFGRARRRKAG